MAVSDYELSARKELQEGLEQVAGFFKVIRETFPDLVQEAKESGDAKYADNMQKAEVIYVDEMSKLGSSYNESGEALCEYYAKIEAAQSV